VCVFELLIKLLSRRGVVEALARRGKGCEVDRQPKATATSKYII
jgi:hypothetical protein